MHQRFEKSAEGEAPDGRELVARHLAGDAGAFSELIELYRAPVFTYLCRSGITNLAKDDLFQDIFIKIHLHATDYDPSKPLRPWLFTIATNTVRSHFRKERTKRLFTLFKLQKSEARSFSAQEHAEVKETAAWLDQAMQKLPSAQREAIALVSLQNMSQEEAAEALGIPLPTLKTNLRRAKLTLSKVLARKKLRESREAEQQ